MTPSKVISSNSSYSNFGYVKTAKNTGLKIGFSLVNYIYQDSIFFALSESNIANTKNRCSQFSSDDKFNYGVRKGLKRLSIVIPLSRSIRFMLSYSGLPSNDASGYKPIHKQITSGTLDAIIEELVFRGIIQNSLGISQQAIKHVTPESLQDNRLFQFIQSPCARVVTTNVIFALTHFINAKSSLSTAGATSQVACILLYPMCSTLYETTGDLFTPLVAHTTNNLAGCFVKILVFSWTM